MSFILNASVPHLFSNYLENFWWDLLSFFLADTFGHDHPGVLASFAVCKECVFISVRQPVPAMCCYGKDDHTDPILPTVLLISMHFVMKA